MDPFLLVLRLRNKRDMVRARQRARQLGGLLGFAAGDQACLAAAVFALACQASPGKGAALYFRVENGFLHIALRDKTKTAGRQDLRIAKALPGEPRLAAADLKWGMQELARRTPLNIFDEIKALNQELMAALLSQRTEKVGAGHEAAA